MNKLSPALREEITKFLATNSADANHGDYRSVYETYLYGERGYLNYTDEELVSELESLEDTDLLPRALAELGIEEMINS